MINERVIRLRAGAGLLGLMMGLGTVCGPVRAQSAAGGRSDGRFDGRLGAATRFSKVQNLVYRCDRGQNVPVRYFRNPSGQDFAVLPVEGNATLFVAVGAASGVRYQAGWYTWWNKGYSASLYDQRRGADAGPVLGPCQQDVSTVPRPATR